MTASPPKGEAYACAARCLIESGIPKAFPLLPLWEAANQKPSPEGRWRLSRKAKTTDEGKVITVTNPFLCNSPPPHISHLRPAGFSFSTQGRSLRLRGSLLDCKKDDGRRPVILKNDIDFAILLYISGSFSGSGSSGPSMVMLSITTSSTGLFAVPVRTAAMASTTSMPLVTLPNAA